jgi:transposase-like protein
MNWWLLRRIIGGTIGIVGVLSVLLAWNTHSLKGEPIIRLILDGTVVRVRLDKKATSISLLVALGVRADGQKVLLAIKDMGGESEAAWRALSTILSYAA